MTLVRAGWLAAGLVAAIGCGSVNGAMSGTAGTADTAGTGEAGGATSSSTTSGTGGAATTSSTTTSSTASSTSGGGAGGGDFVASGYTCSGKQPTLTADVVPIAKTNCAIAAACHLVDGTANGFWHYYVNVPCEECTDTRELIAPGDPEHSYLINKITGKNLCGGYGSMPQGSQLMESTEIQTIYDWVCAGAKDN
jgi:hypothetical protein